MMSAMDQPLDVSEKDIPLRDDIRPFSAHGAAHDGT